MRSISWKRRPTGRKEYNISLLFPNPPAEPRGFSSLERKFSSGKSKVLPELVNKLMLKNLLLAGSAVGASAIFWWKVQPWLADPLAWENFAVWVWPLVFLILFTALSCLSWLLISIWYMRWGAILLPLAFYFLWFGLQPLLLVGGLVGVGLYFFAAKAITNEQAGRLKLNVSSTLRGGIVRSLLATFLLIALAYFMTPEVQGAVEARELPSGITRTLQVIIRNYVASSLPADNPNFVAQISGEVMSQLNHFLAPYFKYAPPVLALSLFLALQGLGVIFRWVVVLLASLIFFVLKLFKAVEIKKVSKEADELSF